MLQSFGHLPIGWLLIAVLAAASFVAFYAGRTALAAAPATTTGLARTHSQPNYHGYFVAMCTVIPAAIVFLIFIFVGDNYVRQQITSELPERIQSLGPLDLAQYIDRLAEQAGHRDPGATGSRLFDAASIRFAQLTGQTRLIALCSALLFAAAGFFFGRRRIAHDFRARTFVERGISTLLFLCAAIAIFTTVGIVLSLAFETVRFFTIEGAPSVANFLFGTDWNAQTGTNFGAVPLFFGTMMIALMAMCVAAPIGLYSAIYLSEYASPRVRSWVKPLLELLAGIPTVVYGFFAALVIAPMVRSGAQWINGLSFVPDNFLAAQPTSALAAGLVMGIMIVPFVSSLSDDVINAVPQSLRDGALAMGATKSETVKQVVLPAALPGVIAALLLAVSRAIGETMIVVMAAGLSANLTANPLEAVTTVTVQIVALLTGDSAFTSAKTLSAFALALVLFAATLTLNIIALQVVRKYQEQYD
ncbi:MAG: phosphate ABC transporter permease subunit PstC [Henriciella sp.]|nr:phosphate ABC transporter permease subunit PstC [Henriciella sp.]